MSEAFQKAWVVLKAGSNFAVCRGCDMPIRLGEWDEHQVHCDGGGQRDEPLPLTASEVLETMTLNNESNYPFAETFTADRESATESDRTELCRKCGEPYHGVGVKPVFNTRTGWCWGE